MLQWMGGSRRKVTTSRGSTQKRQKQYFEQRRRQQQQQTSGADNYLEENVCSTSSNERRSLDVLNLTTLSTVAQECNPSCLNGLEATGIDVAGNKPEINAPQPTILAFSGNLNKDPADFASNEDSVYDPPCSNEMKSSNANFDPWKTEISVLDILEDDVSKCNFRENSMNEDHVSFSVGGLGEVGTETPSPPHRMDPRCGSLCSNAPKGVVMSKNPLNDLELEMDAVLQDIDTSLNGKSSKFSFYSSDQVETFEKEKSKMCFPLDDMRFEMFDGRFSDVICGKRAYDDNEDYKENRYRAHRNFAVDDFLYDAQHNLPWEDGPRREYMTEDCWVPQNLEVDSFKRDTEIPVDSFNFTDSVFPAFHTPEKSINFEEVLPRGPSEKMSIGSVGMSRNPNQFFSAVEDPKDSSMSSEESCSSSAVRRDMDSVAKKSEVFHKIWSPKGHVKCFPREETSHGHRNYVQQGKTVVGTKADTDKFDTSSLLLNMPSRFTIDDKLKTIGGWFGAREKPKRDADPGLASFYKHSRTKSEEYENAPWVEGSMSAFADSKLGDRPALNGLKSKYIPHERAPCTPFFMESHDSPWKPDLSLNSEVECIPTSSFGVIQSPENYKPPTSMSAHARTDQEMKIESPLADVLDCKLRKRNIDYFAMGIVQIGDGEECSFKSDRGNLKIPAVMQSPEFREVLKSTRVTTSDKFLITDNENENQHEEAQDFCGKEAETAIADHKEQRTTALKNIASPLDSVLMHQSCFIQFMCVQQASVEKARETG